LAQNLLTIADFFSVEGSITIVVAVPAYFFLPHTPSQYKFLTEEEEWHAAHRLRLDLHGATNSEHVEEEHFSWPAVRAALLNVNTIAMSVDFLLILVPIYSYSLFLPSIIKGLGYTTVQAQFLTVPPNFMAFRAIGLILILTSCNMLYIKWEKAARESGKRDYRLTEAGGSDLG